MYQCYRNGVEALKKMRKAAGFNPDEAETMMTQMDEVPYSAKCIAYLNTRIE